MPGLLQRLFGMPSGEPPHPAFTLELPDGWVGAYGPADYVEALDDHARDFPDDHENVTTFTVASNEFLGGGREKAEYSNIVTWDRLAEIAGTYLGKGQQVAIEGRLQTRSWDDDRGKP